MRSRLIVPKGTMRLWPGDREVPEGWTEIEVTKTHPDPCLCGHPRTDHALHSSGCLMRISAWEVCSCERFKEAQDGQEEDQEEGPEALDPELADGQQEHPKTHR